MNRLKEYGCTPQHIIETDEEKIQELIKPVGFFRRKATYIKKTTQILLDEYDGDIPDTIEGLVKLPGVGPKMGYLILKVAWNKVDGIGVDVTADGGSMSTGVLEMSNVDLSTEFTEMITTQRGFQANSRIITTSDSMLEELVNLKR